jgi:hypothetical protein
MNPAIDDPTQLVGVAGMTPAAFAEQTAALRGFDAMNEDDAPGSIVLRADYDTILSALGKDSPEFVALTNSDRSVADAMLFVVTGVRVFAQRRSLEPDEIAIAQAAATEQTLIFKVSDVGV